MKSHPLLYKTNYGEQFFDDKGKKIDLSGVTTLFEEKFLKDNKDNHETTNNLLKKGIICTVMMRNLKSKDKIYTSAQDYYTYAVESVEKPKARHTIDLNNKATLVKVDESWKYDMLCPPWFLHEDDSIGQYKNDSEIDKEYGEAIIEFRAIRRGGNWFLGKMGLKNEVKTNHFLTNPNEIEKHGKILFNFIEKFSIEQDFINDISLGICYNFIENKN